MTAYNVKHLAIIMDGNGRWATEKGKDRSYGHKIGSENVRNIAIKASELGVQVLTLYAFSTENWKRDQKEVNALMRLVGHFFDKHIEELIERNVQIEFIGDLSKFPRQTQKVLDKTIQLTKDNDGMVLSIAMNYGGRQEIVSAAKAYAQEVKEGIRDNDVDEAGFEKYLMTQNSEVDLLIRTSGEQRLSNFLLWQLSYSEMIFAPEYWPDFNEEALERCFEEYQQRERTYGA